MHTLRVTDSDESTSLLPATPYSHEAAYPIVPMGEGQIERFRVLVPPYEAGPWAEGAYEITLPVSLIRAFLLPRYIGAFTKS